MDVITQIISNLISRFISIVLKEILSYLKRSLKLKKTKHVAKNIETRKRNR